MMHSFREPGLAKQAAGSPEDLEKGAEKAESHRGALHRSAPRWEGGH